MQRFLTFRPISAHILGFVCVLLLTATFPGLVIGESKPHLTTKLSNKNRVLLRVRAPNKVQKAGKVVRIYVSRSSDSESINIIRRARRSTRTFTLLDGPLSVGTYYYRVQLNGRELSQWSSAQPVLVAQNDTPASPPTQVAPAPPDASLPSGMSECESGVADIIVDRVNQHRSLSGLGALVSHAQLNLAARIHSISMAQVQVMSHDNWFDEIWNLAGFHGSHLGQNVAAFFSDPIELVDAWMESPGHRANILKPTYLYIGVSCVKDSQAKRWWTQDFGG